MGMCLMSKDEHFDLRIVVDANADVDGYVYVHVCLDSEIGVDQYACVDA